MFFKFKKRTQKTKRGFTLVELLVVFFIMGTILAVIVPDYLTYSTQLELENLALDIALTIREAQAYGAGAKVSPSVTNNFNATYGIEFNLDNPTRFLFFEEKGPQDGYTIGTDFLINQYDIKNGYSMDDLCVASGGSGPTCKGTGSNNIRAILIYYIRPNPDAIIERRNNGGSLSSGGYNDAEIVLISPDQKTKKVKIADVGGISVE